MMNIHGFVLWSIVFFVAMKCGVTKSFYSNKASGETEAEKSSRPAKRKIYNIPSSDEAFEPKAERYKKLAQIPLTDEDQPDGRLQYESLRKRTVYNSDMPYGVVYGNGKPIGILKPYPQSYELAPIRNSRMPASERYIRALSGVKESEATLVQDGVKYANERYPDILANFKIETKVRKLQDQRGTEVTHKRNDSIKRDNVKTTQTNKIIQKRNVPSEEPQSIEEIEETLQKIIKELGLSQDDQVAVEKREATENEREDIQQLREDEDLESGSNKIDIRKESHNKIRKKKEGKHKKNKKKQNKSNQKVEEECDEESLNKSEESKRDTLSSDKKQIANYQSEGEAYLRNKRQGPASTEGSDIVKGLETSGELTVSGNKSPLASTSEVSDGKAQTKKEVKEKRDNSEYDMELEKNIQDQIKAIKEQVKREIEAMKDKGTERDSSEGSNHLKRKKRDVQNTLLDEEIQAIDPKTNNELSLKPHIRNKRGFAGSADYDLNKDCTTTAPASNKKREVDDTKLNPSSIQRTVREKANVNDVKDNLNAGKADENLRSAANEKKSPLVADSNANDENREMRNVKNENMDRKNDAENDAPVLIPRASELRSNENSNEAAPPNHDSNEDIQSRSIHAENEKITADDNVVAPEIEKRDDSLILKIGNIIRQPAEKIEKPNDESENLQKKRDSSSDNEAISQIKLAAGIEASDEREKRNQENDVSASSKENAGVNIKNEGTAELETNDEEGSFDENDDAEEAEVRKRRESSDKEVNLQNEKAEISIDEIESNKQEADRRKRSKDEAAMAKPENVPISDDTEDVDDKEANDRKKRSDADKKLAEVSGAENASNRKVIENSAIKDLESEEVKKKRQAEKTVSKDSNEENEEDNRKRRDASEQQKKGNEKLNGREQRSEENSEVILHLQEGTGDVEDNKKKRRQAAEEQKVQLSIKPDKQNEKSDQYLAREKRDDDTNKVAKLKETEDEERKRREVAEAPAGSGIELIERDNRIEDNNNKNEREKRNDQNENKLILQKTIKTTDDDDGKRKRRSSSEEKSDELTEREKRSEDDKKYVKEVENSEREKRNEQNVNKLLLQKTIKTDDDDGKRKRSTDDNDELTEREKRSEISKNSVKPENKLRLQEESSDENVDDERKRRTATKVADEPIDQESEREKRRTEQKSDESKKRKRRGTSEIGDLAESKHLRKRNDETNSDEKIDKEDDLKSRQESCKEKVDKNEPETLEELGRKKRDAKKGKQQDKRRRRDAKAKQQRNKKRRDTKKRRTAKDAKQDTIKSSSKQKQTGELRNRREIRIENKRRNYVDPFFVRKKRSDPDYDSMMYMPYREDEEEADDEGDEFDDDGFDDRTSSVVKKRDADFQRTDNDEDLAATGKEEEEEAANPYRHLTKRQNFLHNYVANMNSDAYEAPTYSKNYLYSKAYNNRRKRQDFDDDIAMLHGGDALSSRHSMSRDQQEQADNKRRKRLEKTEKEETDDQNIMDLSDADLFGALPQSYEGELSRFKRVKRENAADRAN